MTRTPIWKHYRGSHKWWVQSIRAALKSHRKVLTVVSAFVVLGSFALKEVWDERLKEFEDAIKSSQEKADQREIADVLILKLVGLEFGVDEIKESVMRPATKPSDDKQPQYMTKTEVFEEAIDEKLQRTEGLLSVLQDRATLEKKQETLKQSLRDFHSLRLSNPPPERTQTNKDLATRQREWFEHIHDVYQALEMECTEFDYKAYREGVKELEGYQRKRGLSLRLSYFFFGVGWVLGLVASFVGSGASEQRE